jgi:STE24 endopeptidase
VSRRPPLVALVVLLLLLGLAALLAVPWEPLPGADLQGEPLRDFTAAQLAREVAFHDAIRPWSYASLLLGLAVAAVLGLTGSAPGSSAPWRGRSAVGGSGRCCSARWR